MKCPLLCIAIPREIPQEGITLVDCLKGECAWWYPENQDCSVLTIAQGSVYLHKALLNLDSKIPLGGKR